MGTELTGIQDVMAQVARAIENAGDLSEEGLLDVTVDIGSRAAERAPVETGALRGSMTATVEQDGDQLVGEVRFTEKYAAVQHERVDFRHPQGGEAKYLERAALEKAGQIRSKVAKAYQKLFGGG